MPKYSSELENMDNVEHFTNSETNLLSEILHNELSINFERFHTLLHLGAIYVNNERQIKDQFIFTNSLLRVHTNPRRFQCDYQWNSLIVFENDFCLVLNKPSGLPSHPSVDNAIENSLTQTSLARKYPLYVTHRLDTLTSGLIVYAKKQSFVKSFNQQLQARSITKKYVALIENNQLLPKKLTHYMNPAPGTPKTLSNEFLKDWPICELEISEQKIISNNTSWVKLNLLTGRTHQIRAQLAHIHTPLVGDALYGSKIDFEKNAIALRSCQIEFDCGNERIKININEDF